MWDLSGILRSRSWVSTAASVFFRFGALIIYYFTGIKVDISDILPLALLA